MLRPQPAYEWQLRLEIRYALGDGGLTVSATVVNIGDTAAPFGMGFHPYLTVGAPVDELELRLPTRIHLPPTDPDSPPPPTSATGTPLDFHTPRVIGATRLDTAYGGLDQGRGRPSDCRIVQPVVRGEGCGCGWMRPSRT